MQQSARSSPSATRAPARRAARPAAPAPSPPSPPRRIAGTAKRRVAPSASSASAEGAAAPAAPAATTVDRLELLVPSPATLARQRPQQQPGQAWRQPEQPQQQQQQRSQQQQQQQPPQQRHGGADLLGRPPLAPDADPHTGGSALDAVLMAASLIALVFLSMEMYRLFAFVAYSPGFAAWRETALSSF